MWHLPAFGRMKADVLALQASVERAGCALACSFSSSDEFEAAVIRAQRHAGAYGPKRQRRYALLAGAATGAVAITFLII
jgi:hypothetical protein